MGFCETFGMATLGPLMGKLSKGGCSIRLIVAKYIIVERCIHTFVGIRLRILQNYTLNKTQYL